MARNASEDVIIEGMNISAMQRNFELLKNTIKRQSEIINDQQRQIKTLWNARQSKHDSDKKVSDFLSGVWENKK